MSVVRRIFAAAIALALWIGSGCVVVAVLSIGTLIAPGRRERWHTA